MGKRKFYGGFWARGFAFTIDLFLINLAVAISVLVVNQIANTNIFINSNFHYSYTYDHSSRKVKTEDGHEAVLSTFKQEFRPYFIFPAQVSKTYAIVANTYGKKYQMYVSWPAHMDINEERVVDILRSLKFGKESGIVENLKVLTSEFSELVGYQVTYAKWAYDIINLIFFLGYFTLLEGASQRNTLGKKLFGLKIVSERQARIGYKTAFLRSLGKILSIVLLLVGFLMVIWTKKRQGLHDKMLKTLVVKNRHMSKFQNATVQESV